MWSCFNISLSRALLVVAIICLGSQTLQGKRENEAGKLPKLDLDWEDDFRNHALGNPEFKTLLASTLDGSLVAINQATGEILWELDDEPVVRSPYDSSNPVLPAFLPDPKDGSLYMIGRGLKEPLKKLPFTIPELVAASPCKSSDGILYTGKKVDTWFSVDRFTGSKQGTLTFNGCLKGEENSCPNLGPANFLVGRTEYNIMMYDSRAEGRKWNISYFDYSSNLATNEAQHEYTYAHFSDSSRGDLVTLDRKSGRVEWKLEIGSPIVALFRVEGDGIIHTPFTSVSKETLNNLIEHFDMPSEHQKRLKGETKLFATLYVGEHEHGLYAMPSLVDEETLTISPASNGPLLLEGPQNFEMPQNSEITLSGITDTKGSLDDPFGIPLEPETASSRKGSVLLFGYYQVPQHSTIKLSPAMTPMRLTSSSSGKFPERIIPQPLFFPNPPLANNPFPPLLSPPKEENVTQSEPHYDDAVIHQGLEALRGLNGTFILSRDMLVFARELAKVVKCYIALVENKELKIIIVLLCLGLLVLYRILVKNSASYSTYGGSFRMSNSSVGSSGSQVGNLEVTALPVELENGHIKVGNIYFDPAHILGKGCEGTFVYKGKFDNRDVAVKRVLAACFTIADREVELLRESDEHPNVIRYFCMEQDRQFRYIALEYCCATLHDYVTGKYANPFKLDKLTIMRQATQGLAHLHNLDIVHRDIKPHNVLISMPNKRGEVRAMISDFGLCKKLKVGRMSFSHRSGVAGTEGWIAPEIMLGNRSTTCSVDVFSLGCVYYFVLSEGHHPFGDDSWKRQANILANQYDLGLVASNNEALNLIEKMVAVEPSLRPTSASVLKHPLFWSKEKCLNFLQDVSDRVDKEDTESFILASLERNRLDIVGRNWLESLDEYVHEDLRKHRTYKGQSVRDLLRALRNKKHHYNELPEVTKMMYGRIPDQFVDYWTSRFPKLVIHSWMAMHCIKTEPSFAKYFDKDYDFVKTFYREKVDAGKLTAKNVEQNLFMPNFTTQKSIEDEKSSSSVFSVVSQWDKLPSAAMIDLEDRNEDPDESFSEMKPSHDNVKPVVRKVVGQLKSQAEEAKRPETWAKAVQGEKTSPVIIIEEEKENIIEEANDDKEENKGPIWILPQEEEKKKKKKAKKKAAKAD